MYLKRFTESGFLVVYDRVTNKIRRDKPKNVATMKDFYIIESPEGVRDDSIEAAVLGGLEAEAAPLIDSLASGSTLSDLQLAALAKFLAFLCVRVPAFSESYAGLNQSLARVVFRRLAGTPERAAKFLARRRKSLPFSPDKFAAFVNSDALVIPPNKAERIHLMIEMSAPLIPAFQDMAWDVLLAPAGARFVTSDGPMGFIPLEGAPATYGELSRHVLKFCLSERIRLFAAPRSNEGRAAHRASDNFGRRTSTYKCHDRSRCHAPGYSKHRITHY